MKIIVSSFALTLSLISCSQPANNDNQRLALPNKSLYRLFEDNELKKIELIFNSEQQIFECKLHMEEYGVDDYYYEIENLIVQEDGTTSWEDNYWLICNDGFSQKRTITHSPERFGDAIISECPAVHKHYKFKLSTGKKELTRIDMNDKESTTIYRLDVQ